ncbi:MAG: phosphate ABC transporter permease subunit PstC [Chloroflexi bacterium]|nr:phosphate ABC transporter permease subunit PstC [Chloroflexota bacterium]
MATISLPRREPPPTVITGGTDAGDRNFRIATTITACIAPVVLIGIIFVLAVDAWPALQRYGLSFITSSVWNPVTEEFGAAAYIWGTLMSSAIALIISTPISIGCALFVVEYSPPWLRAPVGFVVELLAAIPSIIYGLWGFFVLVPIMRFYVQPFFKAVFGNVPVIGALFQGPALGQDVFTAGVILSIMILPTITSISREILFAVPPTQREGMLAIGATKWETISGAVLPYARSGIAGAAILGLARALGETMAVTLVIGNSSLKISWSILTPGYTMASAIANQFIEADKPIYFSAVVAVGLLLLGVAAIVNIIARLLVWRVASGPGGSAIRAG